MRPIKLISLLRLSVRTTELILKLRDSQWIIPNVYILSLKQKQNKNLKNALSFDRR